MGGCWNFPPPHGRQLTQAGHYFQYLGSSLRLPSFQLLPGGGSQPPPVHGASECAFTELALHPSGHLLLRVLLQMSRGVPPTVPPTATCCSILLYPAHSPPGFSLQTSANLPKVCGNSFDPWFRFQLMRSHGTFCDRPSGQIPFFLRGFWHLARVQRWQEVHLSFMQATQTDLRIILSHLPTSFQRLVAFQRNCKTHETQSLPFYPF